MRKMLLAALAGVMMAGPVLAQPWVGRDDRREWRDDRREWREDRREDRRDRRGGYRDRGDYRDDRRDWNRSDWRWRGARVRGPAYVYPRGYVYRPWNVGYRLPQPYFSNRYFIADPGYYRLPPAYRGARWVRVGPDALLVGIRDGVILQAVRGRYW